MIIYIIKTTLCAAFLLMIYFLFLEKEKMHRFNRFYLLFSLVFSYTVPFITFSTSAVQFPASDTIEVVRANVYETIAQPAAHPVIQQSTNYWPSVLAIAYFTVSGLLLLRFIKNITTLQAKAKRNPNIHYGNARLVLMPAGTPTHSFFGNIFISRTDYENEHARKEIVCHELTHVRQWHSIDILLLELIIIVAWINPVLYFYKRAIQLNHEFLADEKVISTYNDIGSYQRLLLNAIGTACNARLASQFNFSLTKKRFLMMTRSTSSLAVASRQLAILPLLATCIFMFSSRTIAQKPDTSKPVNPLKQATPGQKPKNILAPYWLGQSIGSTKEGVSQELLKEYESIINKYRTADKEWWQNLFDNITPSDRSRLEEIFKQMSPEQQNKQMVAFLRPQKPLPKVVPAISQMESWKNSKVYGVWIDGKRVSNEALNNYSNTDFSHAFVSKLGKNTVNYGKHYYQVDLMTKAYYQDYYNKVMANQQNQLVIRHYSEELSPQ